MSKRFMGRAVLTSVCGALISLLAAPVCEGWIDSPELYTVLAPGECIDEHKDVHLTGLSEQVDLVFLLNTW